MNKLSTLDWVAMILVIVGGLNWGLVVFDLNLVEIISAGNSMVANTIYILVALAALYLLVTLGKLSRR